MGNRPHGSSGLRGRELLSAVRRLALEPLGNLDLRMVGQPGEVIQKEMG